MSMLLLIPVLFGLAVSLLAWGARDYLAERYRGDAQRLGDTWLRFNPEPPDPKVAMLVIYGIYLFLLIALLAALPSVIVAIGFWLLLLVVPRILVSSAWAKRRAKIDKQLPAAIATMANSIRAGLTLVQALNRLADQAPEPIRTEFKVMANRYSFGADLESTVTEAKDRLNLPNFNLFASALLLNREMGGNVSETLDRISKSLDRLHQMRQTVEAHTAEGRTNIKVLLCAPVVMLLMVASADSEGVKLMFTTPQGYVILIAAATLIGIGLYAASKISQSEV